MNETSDAQSVDELRRRMDHIRRNLGGEVDQIVDNARILADWKHYVRTFPWAALGVAAAVGYLAVPRRIEMHSPDAKTLAKLAKQNRLVVKHQPESESRPGIADKFVTLFGNMLLRAAVSYAGQQVGKFMGHAATESEPVREIQRT